MADLRSEGYGNSTRSDAADQPDAAEDLRNVTSLAGVIRNAPLGSFAAYAPLLPGTGGAGQQLVATRAATTDLKYQEARYLVGRACPF